MFATSVSSKECYFIVGMLKAYASGGDVIDHEQVNTFIVEFRLRVRLDINGLRGKTDDDLPGVGDDQRGRPKYRAPPLGGDPADPLVASAFVLLARA